MGQSADDAAAKPHREKVAEKAAEESAGTLVAEDHDIEERHDRREHEREDKVDGHVHADAEGRAFGQMQRLADGETEALGGEEQAHQNSHGISHQKIDAEPCQAEARGHAVPDRQKLGGDAQAERIEAVEDQSKDQFGFIQWDILRFC